MHARPHDHEDPTRQPLNVPPAPPPPMPPAESEQAAAPTRRSRTGTLWVGLIVGAVVLVLLLIFIMQNGQAVEVEFLGLAGSLSLAVAILLGVVAGALLVVIPGTVRIMQLRNRVRHGRHVH
jgi:putative membrane protein